MGRLLQVSLDLIMLLLTPVFWALGLLWGLCNVLRWMIFGLEPLRSVNAQEFISDDDLKLADITLVKGKDGKPSYQFNHDTVTEIHGDKRWVRTLTPEERCIRQQGVFQRSGNFQSRAADERRIELQRVMRLGFSTRPRIRRR